MADIMETARSYAEIHKRACGDGWDPGAITHAWTDDSGDVCISYESGVWFHYRMTSEGLTWW